MQEVPQLATSLSLTQFPAQSWVPAGQAPSHALLFSMQAPLHNFVPFGHVAPHFVPSQVAAPPVGTGQAVQPVPQVPGSMLLAQLFPQP